MTLGLRLSCLRQQAPTNPLGFDGPPVAVCMDRPKRRDALCADYAAPPGTEISDFLGFPWLSSVEFRYGNVKDGSFVGRRP